MPIDPGDGPTGGLSGPDPPDPHIEMRLVDAADPRPHPVGATGHDLERRDTHLAAELPRDAVLESG